MDEIDKSVAWPQVDPIKRLALWRTLLGVDATSNQLMNTRIENVVQDLPNQRVIRVDADRTRAAHQLFKTENMRERIRRIMTYYVKNRSVVYKQGLNELLPPFVLATAAGIAAKRAQSAGQEAPGGDDIGTQDVKSSSVQRLAPDAVIYQCLERTVAKFVPKIYAEDDDFVSLQCSFRLFRLILQYHAPHLCTVLDQYDVPPELYATPWIITLFARMLTAQLVLPLWDFLLWHAAGRDASGTRTAPPAWPQAPDVTWQQFGAEAAFPGEPDTPPAAAAAPAEGGVSSSSPTPSGEGSDADGTGPCAPCGPEILHFVAVAFLLSHSEQLLQLVRSGGVDVGMDLLGGVSRLAFRDLAHIKQVCIHATQLYHATPSSLRDLLFVVCYAPGTKPTTALLARLEERVCAKLTIAELLASSRALDVTAALEATRAEPAGATCAAAAAHDAELEEEAARSQRGEGGVQSPTAPSTHPFHVPPAPSYFLIDCRPLASFAEGHLPTAFHLDPAALLDPERLQHITTALQELQGGPGGLHFAVLGEGRGDTQYYGTADEGAVSVFDRRGLQVPPDIAALSAGGAAAQAAESASKASSGKGRRLHLPKAWRRRRGGAGGGDATGDATEGNDYSEDDVTKVVVLFLLQRGFKYVSEVQGGHTALVQFQGAALQHLLVESPGMLQAEEEARARARSGSTSMEAGRSSKLASRLAATLFSSPTPSSTDTPPSQATADRPRAESAVFGAAMAEGSHSAGSHDQGATSASAEGLSGGGAFAGAHAATEGAQRASTLDKHPLLDSSKPARGSSTSDDTAGAGTEGVAMQRAYAALHRSRQLTHESPLEGGITGGDGTARTRARAASAAAAPARPPSAISSAPPAPPLHVPEDAFLEAQVDSLAGEAMDTSPYVSQYSTLYSWMGDASHRGLCSPLGGGSAAPAPPQPPKSVSSATSSTASKGSSASAGTTSSSNGPKKRWGVLSRLRSALESPSISDAAAAEEAKAAAAAAAAAEVYRKDALLGYMMGALPLSDLKEHIHAGVLSGVAGQRCGRKQLADFAMQWSAADESEVDAHQASDGGASSGQARSLGCGAQLKLLPLGGDGGHSGDTAKPDLFPCLSVPDNKVYACLQRAGAHEGDRLSSPALLPLRRFLCIVGDNLLLLRPRLCPVFASDALSLEDDDGTPSSASSAREAVVGSVVVQLASQADSAAAGLSSPSDPPARMLLAVDLKWFDIQECVPLAHISKRFLKSAVPGMMLVRWNDSQGDAKQVAFVLDNLSSFEHSMERALKRVRGSESPRSGT